MNGRQPSREARTLLAVNGPAMNAWTRSTTNAATPSAVLLLGPDTSVQRALEHELHSLPAATIMARDFDEARTRSLGIGSAPRVVLLPEEMIDPFEFEERLADLRIRLRSPRLVPIAFGAVPSEKRRGALRDVGVDLALFGRFGRHALRFQINRALSPWARRRPRGELRAPQEWRTRIYSSGKEKAVRCYSLSSTGAYFVTPRPWVVGSDVSLELPMGRERRLIDGRILYTNVVGPGSERALPRGMAISFRPLPDPLQKVIRDGVTRSQARLEV